MRDEMFDRDYQAARDVLNADIARLATTVLEGFRALNDIQFRAPWTGRSDPKCKIA